ncbi:unnamed protein product [Mycena citricolor]|uniref:Uncharacterized protein n=2 Tax=Mycena citricolor TaxID=2018698 RepID=A0AAD2H0X2_9AGAR|nr:unnamed protein product [Mycena citricolor]CAK5267403.1 unnamed protein product [Mycena citricolor]
MAESLIQRASRRAEAARAASQQGSRHSTPVPSSPLAPPENFPPRLNRDNSTPDFPPLTQPRFPLSSVKSFGERLAKDASLSADSEAEFRRYFETSNKDERDTIAFMHLLQTKDMVRGLVDTAGSHEGEWAPETSLAKICRKYVWSILCLPNLTYYGGTIETAILTTLTLMKVKRVPGVDSEEYGLFVTWLGRAVSVIRSALKAEGGIDCLCLLQLLTVLQILKSIKLKNKEMRNIAHLCERILKHADPSVCATRFTFMRMAYLRYHVEQNHPVKQHWDILDSEMNQLRDIGDMDFVAALEEAYEDDIEKYGDPVTTKCKIGTSALAKECPAWLITLSAQAAKVQRFSRGQKKRKRQELEEEEEEEEENGTRPSSRGASLVPSEFGVASGSST